MQIFQIWCFFLFKTSHFTIFKNEKNENDKNLNEKIQFVENAIYVNFFVFEKLTNSIVVNFKFSKTLRNFEVIDFFLSNYIKQW